MSDLMVPPLQALLWAENEKAAATIRSILPPNQWQVTHCSEPHEFLDYIGETIWPFVILLRTAEAADIVPLLEALKDKLHDEKTIALVLAEPASSDEAIRCTVLGAADYLAWPALPSRILTVAKRAIPSANDETAITPTKPLPFVSTLHHGEKPLIGSSEAILDLAKQLAKVAPAIHLPVFLNGETGTGKEVVAHQIHQLSQRPGAFRAINCAAMVETLLESELFGHERGAFTGATQSKRGLWEEANTGTIFLDEITESSPTFQAKLLRVLQEGTIRRVGATNEIQVTARIIAASNRNLAEAVKTGHFREDLYYRLGMPLRIPPLRERVEDIPILTAFFSQRLDKPLAFDEEAMRALCSYAWPGNVRELEGIISKLATFVGQQIRLDDVLAYLPIARERLGHHLCLPLLSYLNATMAGELMSYQALKQRYVIEAFLYYRRESRVARLMKMDYRTVINILQSEEAQAIFRSLGVEYQGLAESPEATDLSDPP